VSNTAHWPQLSSCVANVLVAYLVEIFPFAQRTRGIAVFQFFGKGAQFLGTNVNPIGTKAIQWRYFVIYCAWIFVEAVLIYFLWPETSGRSLEELAFREYLHSLFVSVLDKLTDFQFSRRMRRSSRTWLPRRSWSWSFARSPTGLAKLSGLQEAPGCRGVGYVCETGSLRDYRRQTAPPGASGSQFLRQHW